MRVVGARARQNLGQAHGAHGVGMSLPHCPAPRTGHFGQPLGLAERPGRNGCRSRCIVARKGGQNFVFLGKQVVKAIAAGFHQQGRAARYGLETAKVHFRGCCLVEGNAAALEYGAVVALRVTSGCWARKALRKGSRSGLFFVPQGSHKADEYPLCKKSAWAKTAGKIAEPLRGHALLREQLHIVFAPQAWRQNPRNKEYARGYAVGIDGITHRRRHVCGSSSWGMLPSSQ